MQKHWLLLTLLAPATAFGGWLTMDPAATQSEDHPAPPPPPAWIQALDADGDGEVSAEELANAGESLKKLDANGDGKLDREELRPMPSDHPGMRGGRRGPGGPPMMGRRGERPEFGGPEGRGPHERSHHGPPHHGQPHHGRPHHGPPHHGQDDHRFGPPGRGPGDGPRGPKGMGPGRPEFERGPMHRQRRNAGRPRHDRPAPEDDSQEMEQPQA